MDSKALKFSKATPTTQIFPTVEQTPLQNRPISRLDFFVCVMYAFSYANKTITTDETER